MVASPIISVFSDIPGPDVAVIDFLPAKEAPTAAPMPAISSSACNTAPPYFQISRVRSCITSVEGVIGYPPKNWQPEKSAAAAQMSFPSVRSLAPLAAGFSMVRGI